MVLEGEIRQVVFVDELQVLSADDIEPVSLVEEITVTENLKI